MALLKAEKETILRKFRRGELDTGKVTTLHTHVGRFPLSAPNDLVFDAANSDFPLSASSSISQSAINRSATPLPCSFSSSSEISSTFPRRPIYPM